MLITDVLKKTDKLRVLLNYTLMGRTNRIADIFKLGSIDKVRMRVKAKGSRGGLAESVIYCFSDGIFFKIAYKRDSESKNLAYFSVRPLWIAP